jgi:L-rhamnose mutarotase
MKKKLFLCASKSLFAVCLLSCNQQKTSVDKDPVEPMKTSVFTADLKSDSASIASYEYYHSAKGVWKEITEANRRAGIDEVEIYRQGSRLIMILRMPENMDMRVSDSLYASVGPKLQEWQNLMNTFLLAPAGADSGQLWVPMKRIHEYKNGEMK